MDVVIIKNFKNLAIVLLLVCVVACAVSGVSAATKVVEKSNDVAISSCDHAPKLAFFPEGWCCICGEVHRDINTGLPISRIVSVESEFVKINNPNDISTRVIEPPIMDNVSPEEKRPQIKLPEINIPGMLSTSVDQVEDKLENTNPNNPTIRNSTTTGSSSGVGGVAGNINERPPDE